MKNRELDEIRARNSARLAPVLDQVRAGDSGLLVHCAKAYLGLFLNIDSSLSPHERLACFVDSDLLPAIYEGFANAVKNPGFPQAADFSQPHTERESCWVILAAMELGLEKEGEYYFTCLSPAVRKAALCFVMTLEQVDRPSWPIFYARHYQSEIEQALIESWNGKAVAESDYLPGMDWYFDHISKPDPVLVYWLAENWRHIHYGNTYHLLCLVVEFVQSGQWNELADKALKRTLPIKVMMLWSGLALLSNPEDNAARLQELCGFNKEKIVPLLDFCASVMQFIPDPVRRGRVSAALIRIAGPKFPPFDVTDPIVAKLQYAQDLLAQCPLDERKKLIQKLLSVRVLRAYKPALRELMAQP